MNRRTAIVVLLAGALCLSVLLATWPRGAPRRDNPAATADRAGLPATESPDLHANELATPQFREWARAQRWRAEEVVPGRVVVCFAEGTAADRRREVAARIGGTLARDRAFRDGTSASVVALPSSVSLREAIEACRRLDGVRSAEPLFSTRPMTSDPHYDQQWSLHNTGQEVNGVVGTPDADIDAPEAWAIETGSPGVVIAIIDSGADFAHPDLAPNTWFNPGEMGAGLETNGADDDGNGYVDDWRGWNFIADTNDPSYDPDGQKYSHGTDVALVAGGAANNQVAGAGVAWSCKLMHLTAITDWGVNEAVRYAADNGARVINLSLGRYSFSSIERGGIDYARQSGVLVCCASGNDATDNDLNPLYPASYALDNILAVAASDQHDALWNSGPGSGSNYGATTVDLAAPGHNIRLSPLGRTTLFEHDFRAVVLFADDFDDNDFGADWTKGADPGDTNEWASFSGAAYAFQWNGPYDPNARTWVQSRAFSTAGMSGVGLTYFYYVECEANDDFLSVQVWDGAAWHEVRRHTSPTSGTVVQGMMTVDISPYVGPSTRIRFVWNTDGDDNSYLGAIVDDVSIAALDAEWTTGKNSGTDGWVASADGEASANGDAVKPYSANAHTWLQAATVFGAAGARDLQVYYEYTIDSETNDDYLAVEVWDGAAWREIDRVSGPDPNRPGGWSERGAFADATAHANSLMKIRFVWHSDGSGSNYHGAQVRHVEVSRLGGSEYDTAFAQNSVSHAEGTSAAAPHVAGVAALLWSKYPSLTYQEVRSTILATVDVKPSLTGRCVTGGRLNAHSALTYINHEPTAQDDVATVDQDSSDNVIYVLSNDSDQDNDPLTITGIVAPPTHGTATVVGDHVEYTPEPNYPSPNKTGQDTFRYQISDGRGGTDTATVTVTVAKANEPPVASSDVVTTNEDTPLPITLTATDPDGDPLTYHIITPPTYGVLTGGPPNVTYTPAPNYNGFDGFTFLANDSRADSNLAVVLINVAPVNDAPVANAQAVATIGDTPLPITLTASDVDGDPLSYQIVASPTNGTLTGTPPDVTYVPDPGYDGPDSFTFKANDGQVDSNVATVTINSNVTPVADAQAVTTNEDTPAAITLTASDLNTDPLTYQIVTPPTQGTLSGTAPNVTYTPNPDYNGPDSFAFKANDGQVDSNVATVAITVEPVNDAPSFVVGGTLTVREDAGAQTVPGWAAGIRPGPANEAAQTVQFIVTSDNDGLFQDPPALDGAGTLTFTPAPGGRGTATVTVRAQDDGGTPNGGEDTSAPQTFIITVADIVAQSPLPYYQDFSAGKPDAPSGWEYYSNLEGRIRVIGGQLRLDDWRWKRSHSLNEAILHLDLDGASRVVLTFDHSTVDDETHPMPQSFTDHANADGVAFSADGTNWYRLTNLRRSFTGRCFDLDAAVQAAGIAYSADFRIKFQQYDNAMWRWDGRQFDNIRVESVVPQAFPYRQDFSAGRPTPTDGWVYDSARGGRARVVDGRLRLDDQRWKHGHSLSVATLHLDLEGASGVVIQFDHATHRDELDPMPTTFTGRVKADGVAFSADGTRWYRLTHLTSSFTGRSFDLDAAVQAAGIAYTSDFRISFQQYDDCPWPWDGRAIDNISVETLVPQTLPYQQDFAAGRPGPADGWVYDSARGGRARVVDGRLRLDDQRWKHGHSLSVATLHLDLEGAGGVVIQFDHATHRDERDPMPTTFTGRVKADGVAFSADGTRWYRLTDLTSSFTGRSFDLDAAVQSAGIAYTSDFRIMFQQYDDCPWPWDGRAFDNIRVDMPQQPIGGLFLGARIRNDGLGDDAGLIAGAHVLVAPLRGPAPLEVEALALGAKPLANIHWDFGDGSVGIGKRVRHTYYSPGTYTITLAVDGRVRKTTVVVDDAASD